MLGGQPALFAPPELQLLSFETLRERQQAFSDERDAFWLQGTIRALMQIRGWDPGEAARLMAEWESEDRSVADFYAYLQARIAPAMLVDKTPTYALDQRVLERAERDFHAPHYIHLVRHPAAVVESFLEARLDVFFPPFLAADHGFTPAQLGELVWLVSERNIARFLADVPADRQMLLRYEDLVTSPLATMNAVAGSLGIAFHPQMADPYSRDPHSQMTDPVHPLGKMLGDVKFHRHRMVDARSASRWAAGRIVASLGAPTREAAEGLGYRMRSSREVVPRPRSGRALKPIARLILVHPAGGSISAYLELGRRLGPEIAVELIEGHGPRDGQPDASVDELAAGYLERIRSREDGGPYQLAGWSFGGLVAFEMARRLEASGERLGLLALLSSHVLAPHAQRPTPEITGFVVQYLQRHGLELPFRVGDQPPERDVLAAAYAVARRNGLIPPRMPLGTFGRALQREASIHAAHVRVGQSYVPRGRVSRLVLIEPSHTGADGPGPFLAWSGYARSIERHVVPGDHFTMLREPGVATVADVLRASLLDRRLPARARSAARVAIPIERSLPPAHRNGRHHTRDATASTRSTRASDP
jgi:thioesterase domain-containing protein